MSTQSFEDRWIDVGFWVTPEGRVNEAEILRSSGTTGWAKPLMNSIAGRIYSPTASNFGGTYKVERYTFTAFWTAVTASRLRQRSQAARIEYLDLTTDEPNRAN